MKLHGAAAPDHDIFRDGGELLTLVGVAVMNGETSQKQARNLRRQLSTLADFSGHALRTDNLDDLLQEATRLVSEALDVDLVKILELLPDGETMLLRNGVNWHPGVVNHAKLPAHRGSPGGYALHTGRPVISQDVAEEKRFEIPPLLLEHGVQSMVNVVIPCDDGVFGVLEVDAQQPKAFGEDDIHFLQNYANLVASALDRLKRHRELAEAADTKEILLRELQHRVRNMLTSVRALARRLRARHSTIEEFSSAFDARLAALIRSQELLADPGLVSIRMRDILGLELSANGAREGENFAQSGPDVSVPVRKAQALAMIFHELATNAVKHGAFSRDDGRVEVAWSEEENSSLRITWRESGVPINHESKTRGFGSEILERSIPHMLDGTFQRTFHSDGIECVVTMSTK